MDLLTAVDKEIQPAEKEALSQLIDKFEDVFSRGDYDLGSTDIVQHTIDTGDHKPIRQPLRRHPLPHLQAIREQTSEMLSQGLIEPPISESTSNVVLVKKKDRSLRFCINYRRFNEASRKDLYTLPRIDSCLDTMAGAGGLKRKNGKGRQTYNEAARLVGGNAGGGTERRSGDEGRVPQAVNLVGSAQDGGDYAAERRGSNLFAAVAGVAASRRITTPMMGINGWIAGNLAVDSSGAI